MLKTDYLCHFTLTLGGQISLTTDGAPTTMTAPSPTTASVIHPGGKTKCYFLYTTMGYNICIPPIVVYVIKHLKLHFMLKLFC